MKALGRGSRATSTSTTSRCVAPRAASRRSRCPAARDHRRRPRRHRLAAVAQPHRLHRDGGRDRGRRRNASTWSRFSPPTRWRRADQRTIDAGTPVAMLMERAGRAVAWDVRAALGGCYGSASVVVCGKGNNGGDGLVAARVLARWGMRAHVVELAAGVDRRATSRVRSRARDVVVDAMYGTGLPRRARRRRRVVADQLARWDGLTVAVDIPSGVDGLTGAVHGTAVRADRTVTFAAREARPRVRARALACRAWSRSPTSGSTSASTAPSPSPLGCFEDDRRRPAACRRARRTRTSGWTAVMVVGGSRGMTGAPMFVSHAAMRAGAGHRVVRDSPARTRQRARRDRGHHARAAGDADGVLRADAPTRCSPTLAVRCARARARARRRRPGPELVLDAGRRGARRRSCSTPTG